MKQYPISSDGWLYLLILAVITFLVYWVSLGLVILPGILFLFGLFFFRNSKRNILAEEFSLVSPADGVVISHASELNEKNYFEIKNQNLRILVTQVTGFIAHRIVCWVKEIFVPTDVEIMIALGDKVRGGESIIGRVSVE